MCDVWSTSSTPNSIGLVNDSSVMCGQHLQHQTPFGWLSIDVWCVVNIFNTKLHLVGYRLMCDVWSTSSTPNSIWLASVFLALKAFYFGHLYHKSPLSGRRLGLGFYVLSRLYLCWAYILRVYYSVWFRQWAADILCTVILVEDCGCTELACVKLSASTLSGCVQGCLGQLFPLFCVESAYNTCRIYLYT